MPPPDRSFNIAGRRVWVAGHRGMLGSALLRRLQREDCETLTVDRSVVDLRRQDDVERWLKAHRPDVVILAAAHVGGIAANSAIPADFIYDNIALQTNIIRAAADAGVEKLLFLGSSCIYPRLAPQPIAEEDLLSGPLEPSNRWYAIAKISGLMMCQAFREQFGCDFISAMPTNLYGPGDNFDPETSHVVPALIRRFHHAAQLAEPEVKVWGTGAPRREFMHVDDCADALIFILKSYSDVDPINVGVGADITIAEFAKLVADVVSFRGRIAFDAEKPDGVPRKLLDVTRLRALGWRERIGLREGLQSTYAWFQDRLARGQELRGYQVAVAKTG